MRLFGKRYGVWRRDHDAVNAMKAKAKADIEKRIEAAKGKKPK